jgi:hypothetical protein
MCYNIHTAFIRIGSSYQKLIGGDKQTHREHGDRIILLLLFQNEAVGCKNRPDFSQINLVKT